jgi:hypothetical protein
MGSSVSKYFDDLEDKEHWAKQAQLKKKSKFKTFLNYVFNVKMNS